MREKVYCNNCKYLKSGMHIIDEYKPTALNIKGDRFSSLASRLFKWPDRTYICTKDIQTDITESDSWFERSIESVLTILYIPETLNENNDCPYYEKES